MQAHASFFNGQIAGKPWRGETPPQKIIVIRFQALGDTIITLPYLQCLKNQYPDISIIFLTRKEVSAIPINIGIFDKVMTIDGGRNVRLQFLLLLLKLPLLWKLKADAMIDLQNNKLSRIIRRMIHPKAWVGFDTHSPMAAGERTRQTIEALWRWKIFPETKFRIASTKNVLSLLKDNGYIESNKLVVLNPAGFCQSRNWPLDNYVEFALQWLSNMDSKTQFVLLLLPSLREKAVYIKKKLSGNCVDLTGKANQVEAFEIINRSDFMLTEDSGLMHMSWVQGIPTLALFSASRKDWSAPQGSWSQCLDSSDMPCGSCGLEVCKFEDNRCLTRYAPAFVLEQARLLLNKKAAHV